MKNKKLLFKISIIVVSILIFSILILSLLGKKERIGYLSDFNLNIDNTLKINGLDINKIRKEFSIDNKLNEIAISNYIFTNSSITNYNYNFRIKYYSKVFRNSDIYGVYISNIEKAIEDNDYIKKIEIGAGGNPFGNLISTKTIDFEKIDNINYKLILKHKFVFLSMILPIILLIYINIHMNMNRYKSFININAILKNKILILKISIIIIIAVIVVFIMLLIFLGKKERIGYLSDFKLNVDNTLEINGLDKEDTKQLFTIDNKLDNTAITNYIFTNNSITNYKYDFRMKYYSKIFRNSIIHGVYPNLNNLPEYVQSAKMDNRFGTPFGSLLSTKELKYNDKIDTIYYLIINFDTCFYIAVILVIILLCAGFYLLKEYWKYKKSLDEDDYLFIKKIELIGILLFCLQYWLFSPGFFHGYDTWDSILDALFGLNLVNNWHPFLISFSIYAINKIGFTMEYFFFIDLFLWYMGLYLIIFTLYIKFKNKFIILLFLVSFIPQIFLSNVNYVKDYIATLYVFFSYSIVFTIVLFPLNNKNKTILKIISLFSLVIGMLHRHNFIVTIYPMLIWFTYDYLKTKNINNIKKYLFYFINIMIINAIILTSIYFIFPRIFLRSIPDPTRHLYFLQIAWCLVPANDPSLIPENWWDDGKNFDDLVDEYNKDPLFGDPIGTLFVAYNKSEIKKVLIKSILKYPKNYIKHMLKFAKEFFTLKAYIPNNFTDFTSDYINYNSIKATIKVKKTISIDEIQDTDFIKYNRGIHFTKLKIKVYSILKYFMVNINISIYVILSILLFFISLFLLILRIEFRTDILIFIFSVSSSLLVTIIIVIIFTPLPSYRYIYPVIPLSILDLIGFITFIYDRGGLKKFIIELRGKNK